MERKKNRIIFKKRRDAQIKKQKNARRLTLNLAVLKSPADESGKNQIKINTPRTANPLFK